MEKLIPLLNERHNLEWVLGSSRDNGDYLFVKGDKENKFFEEQIISKKFGYIKWLVENDKIDIEKVEKKFYNEICITDYGDKDRAYGKSDLVISVLSISDTPIEDLLLYLK